MLFMTYRRDILYLVAFSLTNNLEINIGTSVFKTVIYYQLLLEVTYNVTPAS